MTNEGHANDRVPRATPTGPPRASQAADEPEEQEPKLAQDERDEDELGQDERDASAQDLLATRLHPEASAL